MTAVLLDHSRRSSAGLFETVLVALQGVGCALFAGLFFWFGIEHPLMWLIILPCLVVSTVAAYLVAWRMFGREVVSVEDEVLRVELRLAGVRRTRTLLLTGSVPIFV
jgi:hypothetical protein